MGGVELKKHILLQNLMVLTAVVLLIVCCIPGIITGTFHKADGTSVTEKYTFLTCFKAEHFGKLIWIWFVMVLTNCIGAVGFRITQASKPLGWVLSSSVVGVLWYLMNLLPQKESYTLCVSVVVFALFLIELILSTLYTIGRRKSIFV